MKNKIILAMIASIIIMLVLSACGGGPEVVPESGPENTSSEVSAPSTGSDSGVNVEEILGEDFRDAMPISAQLGFGTLLLEESEYAIDSQQAEQLLPLWKAARSLSDSETVAQEELEAVFNQIEDTMTPEQLSAINEMQLTGEEMAQLMEDLGIEFGLGGGAFENMTSEMQATAQAIRESGEGPPGGGFPGGGFLGGNPGGQGPGGGPGFGSGNLTPEQQTTLEARRAERGGLGSRFALVFVDPLIELLEERAAE